MELLNSRSMITGLLTLVVIISGFWLRKKGEPYHTGIFTIHKISIVATTVFIFLIGLNHFKLFSFNAIDIIIFVSSTFIYIVVFVSGAMLSFKNIIKFTWKWIHLLSSVFILVLAVVIWLVCH